MYFSTIDYVHKLIRDGETKKARCFWEYVYNMEFHVNAVPYHESWELDKSTTNEWIEEFFTAVQDEIMSSKNKIKRHTAGLRG